MQISGDTDVSVSDALDVFRLVKNIKLESDENSGSSDLKQVAKTYCKNMKEQNIIDQFDLLKILKKDLDEEESKIKQLIQTLDNVLVINPNFKGKSSEFDLFRLLFGNFESLKITAETGLDESSNEESKAKTLNFTKFDVLDHKMEFSGNSNEKSTSNQYCQDMINNIFRMLVNTRYIPSNSLRLRTVN